MSQCKSCGAPLQPNNVRCGFCSTRNDLDFHPQLPTSTGESDTVHLCPDSGRPLKPVNIQATSALRMYRCHGCYGSFFERGELERALADPLFKAPRVNVELIDNINIDRYRGHKNTVRYRKCPVCQDPMVRRVFGYRSGVTVDICRKHGVWLDNGELIHLLEWSKAGGQVNAIARENSQQKSGQTGATRDAVDQVFLRMEASDGRHDLSAEAIGALLEVLRKLP